MALVSLQLGIFNLLPIPILDGGVIALLGIEGLMRRDISVRVKERIFQVGFVFLILLMGIVIFRPFMAKNSIAKIIVVLSIAGSILFLPSVGMYYGFHNWTSSLTNGVVDARFIAIVNTALESPLGQISMIPLLAWIAKNAPAHLKATFFAIFASFTNLALSANALGTKYLNEIFVITRTVKDKVTDAVLSSADYSELGILLIIVTLLTLCTPIITVWLVQKSKFKTDE